MQMRKMPLAVSFSPLTLKILVLSAISSVQVETSALALGDYEVKEI